MLGTNNRTIAYIAFGAFCLLSAIRDVLSEFFFKDQLYDASPVFVLFVYAIVAQLFAAVSFFKQDTIRQIPFRSIWKELLWLNVSTLAAWFFYYLAIDTPLGAALTSFVEYGVGPVFTVLVGVALTRESIHKSFAWSAAASITGIAILAAPRLQVGGVTLLWFLGLLLAVLTSLSSAIYRVYFKILLHVGLLKSAIVFLRLLGTTISLGIFLCLRPELFRLDLLPEIVLIGAFGFAIPMFLVLTVLRRVAIPNFAMLMFCQPAMTYILSAIFGYGSFHVSDLIAAGLILLSIVFHEMHTGLVSKSEVEIAQIIQPYEKQ